MIHSASAKLATTYGDRGLILNGDQSHDVPVDRFAQILVDRTVSRSEKKNKRRKRARSPHWTAPGRPITGGLV